LFSDYTTDNVQSFTVDDTHKAGNIRNEVEGNGFPRIYASASALCGTCRIEHLDGIISILDLSNAIPPLFINESRKVSIRLLGTLEQLVACETEENLRVNAVRTEESLGTYQSVGKFLIRGGDEGHVCAWTTGTAGQGEDIGGW